MKKIILLSLLCCLCFYVNAEAADSVHGASVTISGNLTVGMNLKVERDVTVTGNLSVAGTLAGDSVIQTVLTQFGAVSTGTTLIPADDSIPQSNEGDQYMTCTIDPELSTNWFKIEVMWFGSNSGANQMCVALFQDSTANALACGQLNSDADEEIFISFIFWMQAGTDSSTIFKVRAGGVNSATTTFNGKAGSRQYGGVLVSSITITEYLGKDVTNLAA